MSGADKRLDKLFPALTAQERAPLVLRALKEDKEEDPQVRWTMPPEQAREFNRYIGLINGVNLLLASYVGIIQRFVAGLDVRFAWLLTIRLWGMYALNVAEYLELSTKEPVTQSEYQERLKEARGEMASASELAEMLVERYEGWADADLGPKDGDSEPKVRDAAWERVYAEKKREIVRLVKEGVLQGKRQRGGVLVNVGSFYDWLGEPTPVPPEWGSACEVVPDATAEEVRSVRRAHDTALTWLRRMPLRFAMDLPPPREVAKGNEAQELPSWDEMGEVLEAGLRAGMQQCWGEPRAVEVVVEEVRAEFDGEDPARPLLRQVLEGAKQKVEAIRQGIASFGEPLELTGRL